MQRSPAAGVDLQQTVTGPSVPAFRKPGHHAAGPAPGRPEVDQQRDITVRQLDLKFVPTRPLPVTVKQPLCSACICHRRQTLDRHPVDTATMRTNDMSGFTYDFPPELQPTRRCGRHDCKSVQRGLVIVALARTFARLLLPGAPIHDRLHRSSSMSIRTTRSCCKARTVPVLVDFATGASPSC